MLNCKRFGFFTTVAVTLLVTVIAHWNVSVSAYAAGLPASVDGQPLPTLAPMLERVTPAVVNVSTRAQVPVQEHPLLRDPFFRRFFGLPEERRQRELQSLGSGVIVDAERGFIVTNEHVIRGAGSIAVSLHDGRSLDATFIGADPDTDIAIIQVPAEALTAVEFANSDALRVGDFVVAIGNPFGLGQTATSGIVSALGRSGLGIEDYEDFIQTDASINTGNSGGALVNLRGELVGINTAILAPSGGNIGIGFAIPSNMTREIMGQLITFGRVRRGLLGVALQDLTPALVEAFQLQVERGALIVQVQEGSPAAQIGLEPGDVITRIGDEAIMSMADAHNALGLSKLGQPIRLEVVRDKRRIPLQATLAERIEHTVEASTLREQLDGAQLADIEPGSRLFARIEGVLVAEVGPGSNAARAGLRAGDVITVVNRVRIRSIDDLRAVFARSGRAMALQLQRGSSSLMLVLQ